MVKSEEKTTKKKRFAKAIVELKLLSDRIAEGVGSGAGIFTVKYQMLYLISSNGKTSPQELIQKLNMAKSNLAIMAKKMVMEGLIVSSKEITNKKQVYYTITEKGKKELSVKMNAIDNLCDSHNKEVLKYLESIVETLKN